MQVQPRTRTGRDARAQERHGGNRAVSIRAPARGEISAFTSSPCSVIRLPGRLRSMAYPQQVFHVVGPLAREPLCSVKATTYIDQTGVGRAVYDLFKQTRVSRLHPVTITGGKDITRNGDGWHVSKTELISKVQALLHAIFGATRAEPMMESGFQWIPGRGLSAA